MSASINPFLIFFSLNLYLMCAYALFFVAFYHTVSLSLSGFKNAAAVETSSLCKILVSINPTVMLDHCRL